jgi:hypothetical protein
MNKSNVPKLEYLLLGRTNSVDFLRTNETTRDNLLSTMTELLLMHFPGCWSNGNFLDVNNAEYLVYELDIKGAEINKIRLFDFGEMIRLVRI